MTGDGPTATRCAQVYTAPADLITPAQEPCVTCGCNGVSPDAVTHATGRTDAFAQDDAGVGGDDVRYGGDSDGGTARGAAGPAIVTGAGRRPQHRDSHGMVHEPGVARDW